MSGNREHSVLAQSKIMRAENSFTWKKYQLTKSHTIKIIYNVSASEEMGFCSLILFQVFVEKKKFILKASSGYCFLQFYFMEDLGFHCRRNMVFAGACTLNYLCYSVQLFHAFLGSSQNICLGALWITLWHCCWVRQAKTNSSFGYLVKVLAVAIGRQEVVAWHYLLSIA